MKMQNYISLLLVYALGVLASSELGWGSIDGGYMHRSCIESEKQALLLFKETLVDDSNYLSSWVGDDCCAWQGIGCNNKTNHVTQLKLRDGGLRGGNILPSFLDLKYLTCLDLSNNYFVDIRIPEFFGSFKDLTYLNLSYSHFRGLVPHHLGNLSSLQYLDLSNYPPGLRLSMYSNDYFPQVLPLSMDSMGWLSKLSLLKHLDISGVNLSSVIDWYPAINMLSNSILVLDLSDCHPPNNIPRHLPFMNLTSLVTFSLYHNQLNSSFPLWVLNNSNLAHLSLEANNFNGPIPKSIGSLSALSYLDLRANNFRGLIPQSIANLTSLSTLDLSGNILSDSVSREIGNLTELTYLSVESNDLRGFLPETICQLSKLEILDVSYNQLSGNIPKCIGILSNLNDLTLYGNSWKGFVSEQHFVNLTRLDLFTISSESNLELNISPEWVPPFQLGYLHIDSVKVGPKFPHWLLTQRHIRTLAMPNTSISDTIPIDWFLSLHSSPFSIIDLSNNDINGEQLSLISEAPNGFAVLLLSNNRLSGEFPPFLCNQTATLSSLDLSNNNFSGELPRCLGNLTRLRHLDVMNNNFYGNIPSLGSLGSLHNLNLHNNNFQGKLPLSFQNLTELYAFDVGKNNLTDVLPPWTGEQLPHLKYLTLRSNNFYGEIPKQFCQHSSIEVLNLAHNKITGDIPSCFNNFSAMVTSDITSNYLDTMGDVEMIDDTKGYEQHYTSTLKFLFSIDLSDNNISGEIPEELMDLRGLLNLNLAGNHLVGRIPDEIGKLKNLIFLDLSKNELYGRIPQSLSNLNFLSQLNLSFNDLSGRIPTGNQLQTLDDPSIYVGNDRLCGQSIFKPCTTDTDSHNAADSDFDSDDERMWFYAGIGPGLSVGILGFFASLYFIKYWRYSYFYFVEQVVDKIVVALVSLWKKFHN